MQVTHINTHVTHAVISAGETIEMGVSDGAALMHLLSSTLYTNQILAVVREGMCNAWDAHIEAGKTDVPIEITLTAEKFVIKDFGDGIHHDDIGPIYGVYGNSTKKNDGNQTGGFGLGCKSPFAYTDHFEVISANSGTKTIYTMSKSSAQAQGKPGITPIASFPSTETGLQVTIGIKKEDRNKFENYVETIAHNGDMNVILNGVKLNKLEFDTTKSNYLVLYKDLGLCSHIMVRYGNVVYPVVRTTEIGDKYQQVMNHITKLNYRQYGTQEARIVFQAPAHSIAVTPSRESLSMQKHTVDTLNKLFSEFLDSVNAQFPKACEIYLNQSVETAIMEKDIAALLNRERKLPRLVPTTNINHMQDLRSMAGRYMSNRYPDQLEFRKMDLKKRLNVLVQAGFLNRGLVQTFIHEMGTVKQETVVWGYTTKNTWLQRRVLAPVVAKVKEAGMNVHELYVVDEEDCNVEDAYKRRANMPPMVVATNSKPNHLFNTLPYLRNIVVISSSIKDLVDRAHRHPVFNRLGKYNGFLFYRTSLKAQDKADAVKFFTDLGMEVVDLTFRQAYEPQPLPKSTTDKKEAKVGIPMLKAVMGKHDFSLNYIKEDDAPRIEEPEFVEIVSLADGNPKSSFTHWDASSSHMIVQLFGDKGGIINNTATAAKYFTKGATTLEKYVKAKLCEEMMNNPRIAEYASYSLIRMLKRFTGSSGRDKKGIIEAIYNNPVLRDHFGLINNLTAEDKLYIDLWHKHSDRWIYRSDPEAMKVDGYLRSFHMNQLNTEIERMVRNSPLIGLIDADELQRLTKDPESPQTQKVVEILLTILK